MSKNRLCHGVNRFGQWLADRMNEEDFSCASLANELYVSDSMIKNFLSGRRFPKYPTVIGFCWYFYANSDGGLSEDDILKVWELVEQDKEDAGVLG